MDLLKGNAHEAHTQGTGWFIGFSPWTRRPGSALLHVPQSEPVTGLSMKFYDHPAGHDSGDGKPLSEGRTVSILVSEGSRFRVEFCASADFGSSPVETVLLQRHGDFVAWGEGLHHRWHCEAASTILTLRWRMSKDDKVKAQDDNEA